MRTISVHRPQRISLPDFSGHLCSLPDGPEAWSVEGTGKAILLLGLGPGQSWTLPFLAKASHVYWLEAPSILAALPVRANDIHSSVDSLNLPQHWQHVTPDEAVELATSCCRCFYRPGMRLAPSFWGPLLARLDAAMCRKGPIPPKIAKTVLLPGDNTQLLHQELRCALMHCGFGPVLERVPVTGAPSYRCAHSHNFMRTWQYLLGKIRPAFFLSINLRGLDEQGRVFYLCRELGIPVALWFVDNPWHVLAGLRLPWWRDAHIFVTDASFMPSLRAEGAQHVFHLPLAVAPHMWRKDDTLQEHIAPPLFVGRSSFPNKNRFFAAARIPQKLKEEAATLLSNSSAPADAPNFFWWKEHLGGKLWPGHEVRNIGLGAECCAQANRVRWLQAAGAEMKDGLHVVGDEHWKSLLPGANIQPPVDYYTTLPQMYATAKAVLNVTSLLLPQSLSQRHFDVWASGGVLLSDATHGLDIFPKELSEPIALHGPEDFLPRLTKLYAHQHEIQNLRRAWREHLRTNHTYEQRVHVMLEYMAM